MRKNPLKSVSIVTVCLLVLISLSSAMNMSTVESTQQRITDKNTNLPETSSQPDVIALAGNTTNYLLNISESNVFRNGADSSVFDYPNEIRVINGIGYVASYNSNSLVLIDLRNTSHIIQTTYKKDNLYLYRAHSIVVTPDQKYAYTLTYGPISYLCMWDVSNIHTTPTRLNFTALPSETGMYLTLADNTLILTTKSKIHLYDITNRNTTGQMNELSRFSYATVNTSTYYWHSLVVGNYLYVTSAYGSTSGGFVIFDITDKTNPVEVRRVNESINFIELRQYSWNGFEYLISACKNKPAAFYKGYIYVYNFSSGTLDNPTFLYRISTDHNTDWFAAGAFTMKNGYLFCEQKNYNDSISSGIQIWNLTNINAPSYTAGIAGNGPPHYLNLCHDVGFNQNGSDRTLYVLTQSDDSLVLMNLIWVNDDVPPVASFTHSRDNFSVIFNASSSYDPDGIITTWEWQFGDDTEGTGETTTHTYLEYGTYLVILTVTDNDGLSTSVSQTVVINQSHDVPPVADFLYVQIDLTVYFNGTASYDPDGIITTWEWQFGDNTSGTGKTVAHVYHTSGTYTVNLTVTDNDGLSTSTAQQINVTKTPQFQTVFLFGKITNVSSQEGFLTFITDRVWVVTFRPLHLTTYPESQMISISIDYKGLVGSGFIFAVCDMVTN